MDYYEDSQMGRVTTYATPSDSPIFRGYSWKVARLVPRLGFLPSGRRESEELDLELEWRIKHNLVEIRKERLCKD